MAESKARILFVDDEERILRTLKLMFRGQYEVVTASDGAEALDILRREPPDVIVSDQRMPGMQGTEVLRQARDIAPDVIRVLLTGYSELDAIVGSINEGEIFRFIHKPWRPDAIRSTLAQAVDISRATQQPALSPPAAPERPRIESRNAPLVLVIDEDATTAQLIRKLVETRFRVESVTTVRAAFGRLVSGEIDVIVTELHLAGVDLSPAIKSLKRNNPEVPALVVTQLQDDGALIDLINQAQIFRFLRKPVSARLLGSGIEQAYRHRQALKADPHLAARHSVEEQSESTLRSVPDQILGFIRRLGAMRENLVRAE